MEIRPMIAFGSYYNIAPEQIALVEIGENGSSDYPYKITVYLKTGKVLSINYSLKRDRDKERDLLVKRVEQATRSDYEQLYNKVYLLQSDMNTVSKRQLKIWRQLRDLLNIKTEEDTE